MPRVKSTATVQPQATLVGTSTYYFLLGSHPILSEQELVALFPQLDWQKITPQLLEVEGFEKNQSSNSMTDLLEQLGGTVKILHHVASWPTTQTEQLKQHLLEKLEEVATQTPGKLTIALAEHYRDHLPKLDLAELKSQLISNHSGAQLRYIEGPRAGVSAAVLLHHSSVKEYHLIHQQDHTILAQTVAVQNIDNWTQRDRGKPYADRKKGLLPPKVARIMVNIGLGTWKKLVGSDSHTTQPMVYDPFCGSGTILMEALFRGCPVVGSDLDAVAVAGAQKNIDWLRSSSDLPTSRVWTSEVTHVSRSQLPQPIDIVVTEPFLGKPLPLPSQIPGICRGLTKLYTGAVRTWRSLLTSQGIVVMIIPAFGATHLSDFIDKLPQLGYTILSEPILYARPEARVQREILILQRTLD